ncbi:MAG TPA: hypothetical protein VLA67_13355 [Nitrospiraceae bacterium]|nr:hypothetical protein [Nitrospiraceae bacterium]
MKKKSSFWAFAVAAFVIITMVAYLIFALTLADHMQSDPVPAAPTDKAKPSM